MARYALIHDPMTHRSQCWQIAEKPAHGRTHGEIVAICNVEAVAILITDLLNEHDPQKGNPQ